MEYKRLFLISCLLATVIAWKNDEAKIGAKSPTWTLKDVRGKEHKLENFSGKPVLIIGSDKGAQGENEIWGEKIAQKYGNKLTIIGVADLKSVPRLFRWKVRGDLQDQENAKSSARRGVPLLLDWEGHICRPYGFKQKVSNLVLVDAKGVLRYIGFGNYSEESFSKLCAAIDSLNDATHR